MTGRFQKGRKAKYTLPPPRPGCVECDVHSQVTEDAWPEAWVATSEGTLNKREQCLWPQGKMLTGRERARRGSGLLLSLRTGQLVLLPGGQQRWGCRCRTQGPGEASCPPSSARRDRGPRGRSPSRTAGAEGWRRACVRTLGPASSCQSLGSGLPFPRIRAWAFSKLVLKIIERIGDFEVFS